MKDNDTSGTLTDRLLSERINGTQEEPNPPISKGIPESDEESASTNAQTLEYRLLGERISELPPTRSRRPSDSTAPAGSDKVDDKWETIASQVGGTWRFMQYPILLPTLLCITGLLGFYLYVQTVSLIESLLAMPLFVSIPLYGLLIILVALVICGLYDYWRIYRRLKKNIQVVWSELDESRSYIGGRSAVHAAHKYLIKYLKDYPIQNSRSKSEFFGPKEIEKIVDIRARLTDENCPDSIKGQKDRFRDEFQFHLDTASQRRIDKIANFAAFKTAISPYPVMDMLIILFWSFKMIGDLCSIYNVRTGFIGTVYLLCCVFSNAFIAGKLDEFESEISKTAIDTISKHTSVFDFLPEAMQGIANTLAGRFAGTTTTGFANYLLMKRLGWRSMQMLKPLR
jgi:uncharacterized membrane protein YcjF (UPF0283 family)